MSQSSIVLDGKSLSIDALNRIARENIPVVIDEAAMERVEAGRRFVLEFISKDAPQVYGLNVGVGANKDVDVPTEVFSEYNRDMIYAHCCGVKPEASEELVRATMAARLNTLLVGCTGVQPAVVRLYRDFLNNGIHPIMPRRGSVGAADITVISHLGLAMMGEGEVIYHGQRMAASQAIEKAGLKKLIPGPKDGLAIVSSNALSGGYGALVLKEVEDILDVTDMIYSLTLEGMRYNSEFLDPLQNKYRPLRGQAYCLDRVLRYVEGSYIWKPGLNDSLLNALSSSCAWSTNGSVRDAMEYVLEYMDYQLNTSDDCPCIYPEEGRIIGTANFEVTSLVLGFEMLAIALSHLSKSTCFRILKLADPKCTGLSRFLTPRESTIAYAAIQKSFTALDTEIRNLANPSSMDYYAVAADMEDHSTNLPFAIEKIEKILDNLRYILGMEAIHAAQAVDLQGDDVKLGRGTAAVYEVVRSEIPFLDKDRNLSVDIEKAYQLIRSGKLLNAVKRAIGE